MIRRWQWLALSNAVLFSARVAMTTHRVRCEASVLGWRVCTGSSATDKAINASTESMESETLFVDVVRLREIHLWPLAFDLVVRLISTQRRVTLHFSLHRSD
jgi:hypothetical protein